MVHCFNYVHHLDSIQNNKLCIEGGWKELCNPDTSKHTSIGISICYVVKLKCFLCFMYIVNSSKLNLEQRIW